MNKTLDGMIVGIGIATCLLIGAAIYSYLTCSC